MRRDDGGGNVSPERARALNFPEEGMVQPAFKMAGHQPRLKELTARYRDRKPDLADLVPDPDERTSPQMPGDHHRLDELSHLSARPEGSESARGTVSRELGAHLRHGSSRIHGSRAQVMLRSFVDRVVRNKLPRAAQHVSDYDTHAHQNLKWIEQGYTGLSIEAPALLRLLSVQHPILESIQRTHK
jgi:hypothetical protein